MWIKNLQPKDTYCKHILNTLKICSVKNKFTSKENISFKMVQDVDKSFETLVILKCKTFTMSVTPLIYKDMQAQRKHIP